MKWTIGKKLITGMVLGILSLTAILSITSYYTTKSYLIESAQKKLISDLQLGYRYMDGKFPGPWEIKGDQLYKGAVLINGNNDLMDEIGQMTGGNTVTIFQRDTRVATNVMAADGKRAINTKISETVGKVVLADKKRYVGRAEVVGHWNQAAYDPLFNSAGEVIGIWYTGVPEQPYIDLAFTSALWNSLIGLSVALVVTLVGNWFLHRTIITPLKTLRDLAGSIADFNLKSTVPRFPGNDEIGELGRAFGKMGENLREIVRTLSQGAASASLTSDHLSQAAHQTGQASTQVAQTIAQVAEGAAKQAEYVTQILKKMENNQEQVLTGYNQAAQTVEAAKSSTQAARTGNGVIAEVIGHLMKGNQEVEKATRSIQQLGRRSQEISHIITTITEISNQTNLLALNAAIEAARAGEQGRGFAVVAEEVRKLAEESKHAADLITSQIQEIQAETAETVKIMESNLDSVLMQEAMLRSSVQSLQDIVRNVEQTEKDSREVQRIFMELKASAQEILRSLQEIAAITEQSAASSQQVAAAAQEQTATVEEITAVSDNLAHLSEGLAREVNKFSV